MQGITDKHKATHEAMMRLTAEMPMIQYGENFQEYYAGTFSNGSDLIIARTIKNFSATKLANAHYNYTQIIITGGISLESLSDSSSETFHAQYIPSCSLDFVPVLERDLKIVADMSSVSFELHCGGGKKFTVFDFNRPTCCQPNTWIAFIVSEERLPMFFRRDSGFCEAYESALRDWHKDYKPRPLDGVCAIGDDNRK